MSWKYWNHWIFLFYEWWFDLLYRSDWFLLLFLHSQESRERNLSNDSQWASSYQFLLSLQYNCSQSVHSKSVLIIESIHYSLSAISALSNHSISIIQNLTTHCQITYFISYSYSWFYNKIVQNKKWIWCNYNDNLQILEKNWIHFW